MEPLPRFAVLSQVAKDGNGLPFLERAPPVDRRPAEKAERERQKEENRQNQKREDVSPDGMVGRFHGSGAGRGSAKTTRISLGR